jgi:epsilon-lactone hydrolase
MSLRAGLLSFFLRHTLKRQMASFKDLHKLRNRAGAGFGKTPAEVASENIVANGVSAEWVRWRGNSKDPVMLYLHGGGYVFGGLNSHRGLAWRLAKACACQVLVVDYRLAPEHLFPAALVDALASYQWLLDQGVEPERIVLGGDSAGASMQHNASRDAMLSPEALTKFAELYLGDADPMSPFASPVFADLSALPSTYVVVGSDEVLRDDAERLVEKIRRAAGQVKFSVWPQMPHVFPLLAPFIPEGVQAIEECGTFVRGQF